MCLLDKCSASQLNPNPSKLYTCIKLKKKYLKDIFKEGGETETCENSLFSKVEFGSLN